MKKEIKKRKEMNPQPVEKIKMYESRVLGVIIIVFMILIIFLGIQGYEYPFHPPGQPGSFSQQPVFYTEEDCKKIGFNVDIVDCRAGLFRLALSNVGEISLNGTWLAIISTDKMQALIANDTERPLGAGGTAQLFIHAQKLSGAVNKLEVVFQPCPFAVIVKENLDMACD